MECVEQAGIGPDVAPLRGRGLKHLIEVADHPNRSRSLTGAWIETGYCITKQRHCCVAPLRGRGLKHADADGGFVVVCRSLTGAWIETSSCSISGTDGAGRSLTGAWIETTLQYRTWGGCAVAPLRGRGLKPIASVYPLSTTWSLPYGGVD